MGEFGEGREFPLVFDDLVISHEVWLHILESQPPSYGIMLVYNGLFEAPDATVGTVES